MKIHIRASDIRVTKALRSHVELRLGFALSRFGEHIGHVAVHLSRSEERSDRAEKRCRIVVGLPRHVKVQETDADLFAAVARAADRAARSVAHAIDQDRTQTLRPPQLWKDKKPRSRPTLLLVASGKAGDKGPAGVKQKYAFALRRKSQPLRGASPSARARSHRPDGRASPRGQ